MTQKLESIDRIFGVTPTNMGKVLMKKLGNMCERIGHFSKEMESMKRKLNRNSSTEKVQSRIEEFTGYA